MSSCVLTTFIKRYDDDDDQWRKRLHACEESDRIAVLTSAKLKLLFSEPPSNKTGSFQSHQQSSEENMLHFASFLPLLTLPYHTGKMFYRLALRPLTGRQEIIKSEN